MQHINKTPSHREPRFLKALRKDPGASYENLKSEQRKELYQILREEQAGLCAYCLKELSLAYNPNDEAGAHIEHLIPQAVCKNTIDDEWKKYDLTFTIDYKNMLAVCSGKTGGDYHCDSTKGSKGKGNGSVLLTILNPTHKSIEDQITCGSGGKLGAAKMSRSKEEIEHDIDKVLNLNASRLKIARKAILDSLITKMKKDYGKTCTWKREQIEEKIRHLKTNKGIFYMAAVCWLRDKL